MNTIDYIKITFLLVAVLFVGGLYANAQDMEVRGATNVGVTVVPVKTEIETDDYGEGDPDRPIITGAVNSEEKKSPEPGERVMQPTFGGDEDDNAESVQYNESDFDFLQRNAVSVKAVQVRGWDPVQKKEFLAEVKAHAEVKSGQELENFARGVLLKDENVGSIEMNEEGIQIAYSMPARFVGVFKSSVRAHVAVDASGRVKVKYPWYGFLFGKVTSAVEIEAEAQTAFPEVDDEVLVGFEHRASALENLVTILKNSHEITMNSIRNLK